MRETLAFVLAGGEGRRLFPLTEERSKPAVYFGGRYRLIDLVLSNLVNSDVRRIKVLTQYKATSLLQHISRAWGMSSGLLDQYIDPVPAAMNLGKEWYRGTADAIYQNLDLLRYTRPHDVLVFGSDHVYKMDVSQMVGFHQESGADLTVATLPVPRAEARAFGCLKVDEIGRVVAFVEKPADPPEIPGRPGWTLVSMGNYVFRTEALLSELRRCASLDGSSHDFGKDILASAHERLGVFAYDFMTNVVPGESVESRGYWRDVGTLDSYFEASMDLVSVTPRFSLYNAEWPVRGLPRSSGPAKFVFSDDQHGRMGAAFDSIVGAGTILSGGRMQHTVCFNDVRLNSFSTVRDAVLFPRVTVGRRARLRNCIIDKGVHIPEDEVIGEDLDRDRERFTVSEGGVVAVSRRDFDQLDEFDINL
ncbi:MAG: glucose-1-phosphate adenylyltransferase [Planctomycetes bacterium]|nr:glucose-1-phosphate adenylyltransferase [Planctomycetota bacterium]